MACLLKLFQRTKQNEAIKAPVNKREEGAVESTDADEDDEDVYHTMDNLPVLIQKGLYIGSFLAEQNIEALKSQGITHILQVSSGLSPSHSSCFGYLQIGVQDKPSEDIVAHFDTCFRFIDDALQAGGSVLVHCLAGASRSATVCIGYLMARQHLGYEAAFSVVAAVRPEICPNQGFMEQLQQFHAIHYDLSQWKGWQVPSPAAGQQQPECEFCEDDLR